MKHQLLKALLQKHLDYLKAFPMEQLKRLDPVLHSELIAASRLVDRCYFQENHIELIAAIFAAEAAYLAAFEKHFSSEVSKL